MQICPELGHLVSLRGLLPEAELLGAADVPLSGCTCDSRKVRPGDLFIALAGSRHDGNDFIAEAIERGCAAVISEKGDRSNLCEAPSGPFRQIGPVPFSVSVPVCFVPNARESHARLCQALAGNPSRQLKLIGVTGTNGKTTTTCLIAGIFKAAGYRVGVLGTLGYLDGRIVEPSTHTTPPPDRLASLLAQMVRNGCTHAVMEVSSHALDQSRIAGVRFDAACVTNVTRDHLDYHGTLRDYRRAKARLFDHLADDGFVVLNADDPGSAGFLRRLDGPVLTVGIREAAEITATPVEQFISEQTFLLTAGSETVPVRTPMIGTHHIYNCLTAAAVGLAHGIELTTIVRGLEYAGQVPGRLERIECGQPFGVFVDYAHTPDALTTVLKTLREVTAGRLICVFGAGGQRDREKRPLMGRAVEQTADLAMLTNDNPRHEDPQAIFRDVLGGFLAPLAVEVIPDRATAIHQALTAAHPGDCVLIAGKGHENHQIIGDQRLELDDREVARQWLYEKVETPMTTPRGRGG
ncbi:MAG: UDP-N-acetylmuramoyl-L-alanyl-D-glutamate--2,6-diaminopimelate ligase [Planctomycetes bacterium]|nr:UDP-N-acetylmuramoyl-L-alanyl-D-glutamate--2,6-diaminopimelate ligase [Planctomycetota bacterium]MCG2684636.1 UDP-N-acetylmuramoyl-L-alanyl-D-glutamate--2,6-diaminopimelate ligase [Planctomycetales bacterium]